MKLKRLLDVDLTLFDGGAAAGGEGGAAAPTAGNNAGQAGKNPTPGSGRRAGKSGGLGNVVYGRQQAETPAQDAASEPELGPDAGGEKKTLTKEEKRAKFRELVDNEYKDIYAEEFQNAFDRRFKAAKETEEALSAQKPILDALMEKYKIADGDVEKLREAIEQDDSYWSAAAEEAGMSVEQYKKFRKLQRENEAFKEARRRSESRQAADRQIQRWYEEAETVKQTYPNFDLAAECRNPQFLSMLRAGVPVGHAYEVFHLDDIKNGLVQATARQTEKKVVDGIRAKGARPAENGVSSQSGVTIKSDVSRLSRQDRAEIARRVARGETITF